MSIPKTIHDYLHVFANELGERIVGTFPALQNAHDPVSPRLASLLRRPFPAQALAAMGVARKWENERSAAVIAECGTGKTIISLAAVHVHSDGRPFTGIVMAPLDFIGRYMADWFDYAICDEAHQLANDTAQGNALGTLAACADRTVILTGTLLGGYADDVYNLLFRLEPGKMVAHGYEWGEPGLRLFAETYGVLEKVTTIEPADNSCSKARVTKQIKRKPGASPHLFSQFLMGLAAFVSLEDISSELPLYTEEVIGVPMDAPLRAAYKALEEEIKNAIKEHRGNHSVVSVGLNALLLYADRPWDIGDLYGYEYNPETERRERFLIAQPESLDQECLYAKEKRLIELVKSELHAGRRCCHVYAVYTQKRDVTRRLESILTREGTQVAVLTSDVPPEKREAWFTRKLQEGVQVTISHPKIIETGMDLLSHPSLIFYQSGYSLHTLRQASRRSWRIGQRQPVRVFYLHYEDTMQAACLRLMGKKLLVSLAMEGKFSRAGLQSLEEDDDMLTAMARELVTEKGVGESADLVWRQLQAQQTKILTPKTVAAAPAQIIEDAMPSAPPVIPAFSVPAVANVLRFGSEPPSDRPARHRQQVESPPEHEQFSLF